MKTDPDIRKRHILCDIVFVMLSLAFVLCAYQGNKDLTPDGVGLDSDLQGYVQMMEWQKDPAPFEGDIVAQTFGQFPSMTNFMISLSYLFDGEIYQAVLKAGTLTIFIYLVCFYVLGRWLYGKPSLAVLLTILMSVTIYWKYGTFWGATHSDPVPRILATAFFPLLLILAIKADKIKKLRYVVMFLCGVTVVLHPIKGIAMGTLFFMAFLFAQCQQKFLKRIPEFFLSALSFLVPALYFIGKIQLSKADATTGNVLDLYAIWQFRFAHDYSDMVGSLLTAMTKYTFKIPIFLIAIACMIYLYRHRKELPEEIRTLLKYLLGFILGILFLILFVYAEMTLARYLGRNALSNEFLRGTKFFIPIALLVITTFIYVIDRKFPISLPATVLVFVLVVAFAQDKQLLAARHYVAKITGCELVDSQKGKKTIAKNNNYKNALRELERVDRKRELVFTDVNDMAVRYVCHLPLVAVLKDGDNFYYNKDVKNGLEWLEMMKILYGQPNGPVDAWVRSGARFYLSRSDNCHNAGEDIAQRLYSANGWSICKRK